MSDAVLALEHLTFSYGEDVVFRDLSLTVQRGAYLGVIGTNGGGKSTLLRIALGLLPPARGSVELFGTDVRAFRAWRRVAYVSQRAAQVDATFPITVEAVVAMGRYGWQRRLRPASAADRVGVEAAMRQVGVTDLRSRRIGDLSGGERQRVFLARALASAPELLILDEPTTGVDAATQEQFYDLLRTLHRDAGLTVVLASHDIAALAREATALIVVQHGLVFSGTPAELLAHPDYATILREVECYHHH